MSILLLLVIVVNFTSVQNYIVKKAANSLSEKLNTVVSIDHIRIDLLNHVLINGVYIEDHHQDTLLYAGEVRLRLSDWFMLSSSKPEIKYVGLHSAFANLYRTDSSSEWNYEFIGEAFASNEPEDTTTKEPVNLDIGLKEVNLSNIRFYMNDAWAGSDMNYIVGKLRINARDVDLTKKKINLVDIKASGAKVILREYKGGEPESEKANEIEEEWVFSPFNAVGFTINLSELDLKDCLYQNDFSPNKPLKDEFDVDHIAISNVSVEAENVKIIGDTITGHLKDLRANERSGINITNFTADITVSPNESVCENMVLKTNHSTVKDYYAMRYNRFPDYVDFIDKVILDANLKNSKVDVNDIAYFAPILKKYPAILDVTGIAKGPISNIKGQGLFITDGTSKISGDLSIKGLTNIDNTIFDFKDGEIITTGNGIAKYIPSLRDSSSTIAIDSLKDFVLNGNYKGTIYNFIFDGTIKSNLGNLESNIKLDIPSGKTEDASYSGELAVDNFKLGVLFKTASLGSTTFKTTVNGKSLNLKEAEVKLDALVDHFDYGGYRYQNISADGVIARKKFEGNLLVNDENLTLGFYGSLDYSTDTILLNAKANLLASNLTALKLVKEDTVNATADFDLDCSGSSIDNFVGYAKLYNIDINRDGNRIDLDSISVVSSLVNSEKHLKIESNALYADIQGEYTLSSLPASFQYYVAGYLPAYIKRPTKDAPDQEFKFAVKTRKIDRLLTVLSPSINGFNNVSISGSLSTRQKVLNLSGTIPYGKVNNIYAKNTTINSHGDFDRLGITLEVEKVILGDSVIKGTLDITTTLGNNTLDFQIATSTPDIIGTAKLKGKAIARNDSLYLSILNSEFYINNTQWEIPSGNKTIIAGKYLSINNFNIQAGLQRVSVNSKASNPESIDIEISNLDISQIGKIVGISDYEPEGRINGIVNIEHALQSPNISSNVQMSNVKFGVDTIGSINIIGSYSSKKNTIRLEKQTGIVNGDKSLSVYGNIAFDSLNNEKIDGNIAFENVPVSWGSAFLKGYISKLSGDINGRVKIEGTAKSPNIKGLVRLNNTAMNIDILGTYYKIPKAEINVDNSQISLGTMNIYDIHENKAVVTGGISHRKFRDMQLGIKVTSPKFEVISLESYESDVFYGNFIAGFKAVTVTGPMNDIDIRILKATPAAKSHLYLPLASSTGLNNYNYVKFKTYGKEQKEEKEAESKLNIHIEAVLNPLGEVTMIMDPTTGDAINAKGSGNLIIDMPSSNDFKMYGVYTIDDGSYIFTLKQLFLKRQFQLNKGSIIRFNGPIYETGLDVEGIYTTRARLYDLLSENDKTTLTNAGSREVEQTKMMRDVNVLLFMAGTLGTPELKFKINLPDNSAEGTLANSKLNLVNEDDQKLLNQVASLLLLNTFISTEGGIAGANATGGVINNISDMLSSTASSQLTNLLGKITGDESLSVSLKYKTYNYSNASSSSANRNEVSIGLRKNYFDNRLSVEVGSAVDWGKPSSSNSASTFKPVGDFRVQYLMKEGGNLRANIFRTSSYDIFADRNISRAGLGLSWRKSFNTFGEFFRGSKYIENKKKEKLLEEATNEK